MTSHALWYIDRGAGLATLLLLTISVVLGVVSALRFRSPRWPRFALADLHRNLALLALAFGAVHIFTAVIDSYVPIALSDVVVPFGAAYKPIWLGLGAIGADLMLAVLLTSALRRRIRFQTWRSIHMLSYGCWGAGLIHALGMGSDARTAAWAVLVVAACIGAVGGALVQRTGTAHPH